MADLPLAGLFLMPHERHLCGLLSRHITNTELCYAAEALLRGQPAVRPRDMLQLLLAKAPRPAPGTQIKEPTDTEFQCGCGIVCPLLLRRGGVRKMSQQQCWSVQANGSRCREFAPPGAFFCSRHRHMRAAEVARIWLVPEAEMPPELVAALRRAAPITLTPGCGPWAGDAR